MLMVRPLLLITSIKEINDNDTAKKNDLNKLQQRKKGQEEESGT